MELEEDISERIRMIETSVHAIVPTDFGLAGIRHQRFQSPGFDPENFAKMGELGWLGLRVGEEFGGLGMGMREYCALAERLGMALAPEPLIGAALACKFMEKELPDKALTGEAIYLAAWQDAPNSLEWRHGASVDHGRISGAKQFVPSAGGAGFFAVPAMQGNAQVTAIVRATAPGVGVTLEPTQDGGEMGLISMSDVDARIIPAAAIDEAIDEAALATAAYCLGLAHRAFDLTIDYLKLREQFGRPIGSFQALQHRAVDLKIQLELTRASVAAAAKAVDARGSGGETAAAISRAKRRASDTAMLVAREAVQMHGAIGYTDEYDIGLFVRKAMTTANLYGGAAFHRRRHAEHMRLKNAA